MEGLLAHGGQGAVDLNNYLKDNGIDTGISDEQAMSGGETAAYMATGALAMTALNQVPKLFGSKKSAIEMIRGKKSTTSDTEPVGESKKQPDSDKSEKSINPNHDIASLSSDIKNYTQEYGKEQALAKSILYMFL